MPKYVSLMHRTEQGSKTIKEAIVRLDAARKLGAEMGCSIESFYVTMGHYDQVAILDAPNDEAAVKFRLKLEAAGAIRIEQLRAFTEDEYRKMIGAL